MTLTDSQESPRSPRFSVVIPVYNRQTQLRRALQSVAAQTESDFQCIVVDDASTQSLEGIVAEFDDRFSYVRRKVNGGCTAARLTGLAHAQGEFVTSIDSDNEIYPWAFARAAHYLRAHPEADGVAGLYMFSDGLRLRVDSGVKVVGPEEYATRTRHSSRSDSVGIVRRNVLKEWLLLRPDYYNLDFVFWLRFRLSHQLVLVDEPWGRYDTTTSDKIAGRKDPRAFEDVGKFVQDFRPLIGSAPCGPVDLTLTNLWTRLIRAHRYREAAAVSDWMRERQISRLEALARKLQWSLRARLRRFIPARAHVL